VVYCRKGHNNKSGTYQAVIAGKALLALIGTVVGAVSGLGLSLFAIHVIPWWANIAAPSLVISPLTISTAAVVIVASAVLSSVYPAHRISKLNTIDALRCRLPLF